MLNIFFFQAEDGIRDIGVTGVQTCALPIYSLRTQWRRKADGGSLAERTRAVSAAVRVWVRTAGSRSLVRAPSTSTPIGRRSAPATTAPRVCARLTCSSGRPAIEGDRKSTRLNSSHANISYAVFCLKKKK